MMDPVPAKSQAPVVLVNFTHVYEQETFYRQQPHVWVDCSDLSGVTGYCDGAAMRQIRSRLAAYRPYGVHFIDSGNFHYVSRFWVEKIERPFVLVLFDNHTDMQPSRFGHIMSCGSWVRDVLDTHPWIQKVVMLGAADAYLDDLKAELANAPEYARRLVAFSHGALQQKKCWQELADEHHRLPVYISIDKDVLRTEDDVTDWNQGDMPLAVLKTFLDLLITHHEIIGIDICGECSRLCGRGLLAIRMNDSVNDQLLQFIEGNRDTK
jgi:hypothetical protein